MSQEKTTIQAAAKALGVTTKTIQRYLLNGTLSKIKEGTRTYIPIDEIRTLRQGQTKGQKGDVQTNHKDRDSNTITLKLAEYKELLQELGHYKGKLEGQTRNLLEYRQDAERKTQELTEARAVISKARSELEKMVEFKRDAEQKAKELLDQQAALEAREHELAEILAENARLKVPWWKRLFSKK
jgi:DNA-binding transcriptional MerR regulator